MEDLCAVFLCIYLLRATKVAVLRCIRYKQKYNKLLQWGVYSVIHGCGMVFYGSVTVRGKFSICTLSPGCQVAPTHSLQANVARELRVELMPLFIISGCRSSNNTRTIRPAVLDCV